MFVRTCTHLRDSANFCTKEREGGNDQERKCICGVYQSPTGTRDEIADIVSRELKSRRFSKIGIWYRREIEAADRVIIEKVEERKRARALFRHRSERIDFAVDKRAQIRRVRALSTRSDSR